MTFVLAKCLREAAKPSYGDHIHISGDILIYNFHFSFSDLSLLQSMLSFLLFLYFLNNNKEMIQLSLFQVIMFRQKYLSLKNTSDK